MVRSKKFYNKIMQKGCKQVTEDIVFDVFENVYLNQFTTQQRIVYDMHFVNCDVYYTIQDRFGISRSRVQQIIDRIVRKTIEAINLQYCDKDDKIEDLVGLSVLKPSKTTKAYIGMTVRDIICMYESKDYVFKNKTDESIAMILVKKFPCNIQLQNMTFLVDEYMALQWYQKLYRESTMDQLNSNLGSYDYPHKFVNYFKRAFEMCHILAPSLTYPKYRQQSFAFYNLIEHFDCIFTDDFYNKSKNILAENAELITILLSNKSEEKFIKLHNSEATIQDFIEFTVDQSFSQTVSDFTIIECLNLLEKMKLGSKTILTEYNEYVKLVEGLLKAVHLM